MCVTPSGAALRDSALQTHCLVCPRHEIITSSLYDPVALVCRLPAKKKRHMGDVKVCVWHKLFLDPWSHRCSSFWMPYRPRLSWVSRAPLESLLRRLFPWKSLNKIYTSLSLSLWWVGPVLHCSSRVHLAYFPLLIRLWLKDYLRMLFFWSSFSYFKTLLLCSSVFWLWTSGLSGEWWLCHHQWCAALCWIGQPVSHEVSGINNMRPDSLP